MNKFPNLREYLREQFVLHKARVLLHRRGLPIVAYAMFRLNRAAQTMPRHLPGKQRIYELKNKLIEDFYKRGYAEQVRRAEQVFSCYRCNGTGEDAWYDGEECDKCGGSGIYRTVHLWDFTFRIGGRAYRWHQPSALVRFHVQTTNPDEPLQKYTAADDKKIIPLRGERLVLLFAVVYVYLRSVGVNDFSRPMRSLRAALYLDVFAQPSHEFFLHVQQYRYRFDSFLFNVRLMLANTARRFQRYDDYAAEREQDFDDYAEWLEATHPTREPERIDTAAANENESPF